MKAFLQKAKFCLIVLTILGQSNEVKAQEIDIQGNGVTIADGATTSSNTNFTDMGVTVNCVPITKKYYIFNTGTASLSLSGSPRVAVSGTHSADFVVSQQPGSSIAAGSRDSFTITFTPGATGNRTASISIANNDANENPYDFAISGFGVNSGNTQLGADIDGEADNDQSGWSVSLSADGSTVAIGAPGNTGGGLYRGHVRVYKNISGTWTQLGADIDGEGNADESGQSVSLSADGSIVAIGAVGNDGVGNDRGHVRVYKYIGSAWTQQGADIDGEADYDWSGKSVSLSSDGTIVAIGANYNAGGGTQRGHVRVYKYNGSAWTQQGADIDGEANNNESGWSVSLSSDGTIVAIGAYFNAGGGSWRGHVRVYKYNGSAWTQQGADIDGEANNDYSGWSVSLSADGSIVAIGAPINAGGGTRRGHVGVYKNNNGTWTQQGADIDGLFTDERFGWSVSLSADGSTVAIGAPLYSSGQVRVYKNISGTWTQIATSIDGENYNDWSGRTVSLSADGSILAIGAYNNAGGGTQRGHVRVYSTFDICPQEIDIRGNGITIVDGATITSNTNLTDMGVTVNCVPITKKYYIFNMGGRSLSLNGSPRVAVSGTHSADFVVTQQPGSSIAAGGRDSFSITFTPGAMGNRTASISIVNNDANENPYNFAISGFGINAGNTQLGADIDGEADYDESGASVSLSADGSTMAIGANLNAGGGTRRGHVRVYKNISGTWTQQGLDIDGETNDDLSGTSVSLSADGSIVAIGAPGNSGGGVNRGHVRVYKNNSGTWTQQGADIDGEGDYDQAGFSVSISTDGNTVAIGARVNAGGGVSRGHVRVYKYNGSAWTQQGADIDGEADNDFSGYSVSLSANGSIVAIGAIYNTGGGSDRGHVRVYRNISGTWTQQGADINGEANGDFSGYSVSLSADGSIVAIGAPNNDVGGTDKGHVRVYKNISGTWTQQGLDIDGEANFDRLGQSVSISADGSTVAIGAPINDGGGTQRGYVRVYKNISGTWTQQGANIGGEFDYDQSGHYVSLSADGNIVGIAAPYNDGGATRKGHGRVYATFGACPAEIEIKGKNISIVDGDVTPSLIDSTDFGGVPTGTKRRYKIFNYGGADLIISGSSVGGTNAADFTISGMPSSVAAGDSAVFTVTFATTSSGLRSATININSNDADEALYNFDIRAVLPAEALDFDGINDYVIAPGKTAMEFSQGTIECWIKPQNNWSRSQTFISYRNSAGSQTRWLFNFSTNLTTLGCWNGSSYWTIPNTMFTANTWAHFAAVDDNSGGFLIYCNGNYMGKLGNEIGTQTGGMSLYLGVDFPLGEWYQGQMDEVRIWNVSRTCSQIKSTMNRNLVGNESGLLAYYQFNEGVGGGTNAGVTNIPDKQTNIAVSNGTLSNFNLTGSTSNWVRPGSGVTGTKPDLWTEINVKGNGNSISSGSTALSFSNFTRFDSIYTGDTQTRKYYVHNTGGDTLYIYGISKTGPDASMFSFQSISYPKAIKPGDSFAIDIKFIPSGLFERKANITIEVNSCPQYYKFDIGGFAKLKQPTASVSPTIFCGGNATITSHAVSASRILYYSDSVGGTFLGSSNNGSGFTVTPPGNTNYYYAQSMVVVTKTIQRNISMSDLINSPNNCGGGIRYSSGNPGFAFTDNTVGTINNINVDFAVGVDCGSSGSRTVFLNSNAQSSVNTNYSCTCTPLESTNGVNNISLNISNFNKGGYNAITIASPSFAMGFMPHTSLGGYYARVNISIADTIYSKKRTKIEISKNCKEINVKGNNIGIADGDNTPSLIDSTDFGNACSGAIRNYKIYNTGSGILAIDSIRFAGSNATDFSVISAPAAVAGYDSAILSVKVMATTTGIKTATIKIYNDDADEAVYDFTLSASLNVKPQFTSCPSNLSGFTSASSCDTIFNYTTTAAGNGNSFTYTFKTATVASGLGNGSGSAFNNGTTNVTVIANNVCGVDSCKFNVIVTDNKAPSITCTGNKTVRTGAGVCTYTKSGTDWNPTFSDNCAGSAIAFVLSGATTGTGTTLNNVVFNKGITTVTWTATDGSSNMSSCNYTVTVNDSTAPSITCTGNKIVNNDNGVCTYTHSGTAWDPTFSDNCPGSAIAFVLSGATTGTGSSLNNRVFNIGNTTVTWTATDAAGNTETCNYLVTVNSPEINVTGNSISIVDNDVTPSLADSTNFGFVSPNTKRRFIIQNTGTNTLSISSVSLSGTNASDFTVSGAPSSIAAGGSASILVTLITTAPGIKTATVTINNNDCNEAVYNFDIQAEIKCDLGSNVANTVGTHVSSYSLTNAAGWTCFCNTSGQLLLALKLGGTGAVVPPTGVELKINSTNATWYPHSTGFIGNWHGWAGLNRTWEVFPTTQPSSQVPVRFFVSSADIAAINTSLIANSASPISNVSQMSFYKVTNSSKPAHSPITNLAQSDVQIYSIISSIYGELPFTDSAYGSGKNHVQFYVSSFSGGGGGSGGLGLTPLSVTMSKQTAKWNNNDALLSWTVASENNNSHFIIQRSENNGNWIEIGKVASKALNGNSAAAIEYEFTDKSYKQRLNGVALYRIVVVSKNGESYRHSPMTLRNAKTNKGIQFMPNPTSGDIAISGSDLESETATVQVWNTHGKLMKTLTVATENGNLNSSFNLNQFAEGVYNVRVVCGETIFVEKVILIKGK